MNIKIFSKLLLEMKIDTLILSGGGPSGIAYLGVFYALFENKIIDKELSNIKEIITTSVGIMFSIFLLLKIDLKMVYKITENFDNSTILDNKNISINDFLVDFGLYSNHMIQKMIQSTLKNILQKDDLTLQELYELTNIKLSVKVFNVSLKQIQYISYETNPDLNISLLAMMTTAIPFVFKPVEYNNEKYVDGGLRGHFPIEKCVSKNYLGIFIRGGSFPEKSKIVKLFPILEYMYSLMIEEDEIVYQIKKYKQKKIIYCNVKLGLDFNASKDKNKEIITMGYKKAIEFITDNHL